MISPDHIRLALVAAALLLTAGIIVRPFYGVVGYLIIMVTRPGLYYPALGAMRIELIIGLVVIAVMLFSPGKLQRLAPSNSAINKYAMMLLGVMVVSMIQAVDFFYSKDWMIEFAKVAIFFMMIVTLSESEEDVGLLLTTFALLMAYLAYQAIYNFHTGIIVQSTGGDRIDYATAGQGMGSGHVALSNLALQGMPVLWFFSWQSKNMFMKAFGFAMLLICLYGVVISGSRGGFIGLIAFYLCILYMSKNKMAVGLAGIAGVFLLPKLAGESYFAYMDTILGLFIGTDDLSSSSRITGLRHGFEMLLRRPLLGVGPGCYPLARREWFGWGLWAHNHYGELMGDLGMVGTIVWFKFLVSYMRRALDFVKHSAQDSLLQAMALAVVVATIVRLSVGMGTHSLYIFFWYMMAAVVIVFDRLGAAGLDKDSPQQSTSVSTSAQVN